MTVRVNVTVVELKFPSDAWVTETTVDPALSIEKVFVPVIETIPGVTKAKLILPVLLEVGETLKFESPYVLFISGTFIVGILSISKVMLSTEVSSPSMIPSDELYAYPPTTHVPDTVIV